MRKVPVFLLLTILLLPSAVFAAEPEIVVSVYQKSSYFALFSWQYRVFFNKFESKFVEVPDYDLASNLRYDLMDALTADKRAHWRAAGDADKIDFPTLWDKKNPPMPPELKADGVLLVFLSDFGAAPGKHVYLAGIVKLLDRSGKKLWQKTVSQEVEVKKSSEEWQLEDPANIKPLLNDLEERMVEKILAEVQKEKVTR